MGLLHADPDPRPGSDAGAGRARISLGSAVWANGEPHRLPVLAACEVFFTVTELGRTPSAFLRADVHEVFAAGDSSADLAAAVAQQEDHRCVASAARHSVFVLQVQVGHGDRPVRIALGVRADGEVLQHGPGGLDASGIPAHLFAQLSYPHVALLSERNV